MSAQKRSPFYHWLMQYHESDTPIGDLARDAYADCRWDGSLEGLDKIVSEHGCLEARDTVRNAKRRYRQYEARRKAA